MEWKEERPVLRSQKCGRGRDLVMRQEDLDWVNINRNKKEMV